MNYSVLQKSIMNMSSGIYDIRISITWVFLWPWIFENNYKISAWGYAAINFGSFQLYYTEQISSHGNTEF